jgi:hypothetical protein
MCNEKIFKTDLFCKSLVLFVLLSVCMRGSNVLMSQLTTYEQQSLGFLLLLADSSFNEAMALARQHNTRLVAQRRLVPYYIDNDTTGMYSILLDENTPFALRSLISQKARHGNIDDAQSLLDTLPATTPDELDYKAVQQIKINRSVNDNFELNESLYQQLNTIAEAQGYQAPAACALLSLLRGEYCEWQLPNNSGSGKTSSHPRYKTAPLLDKAAISRLNISPNPANNSITVQLPVYLSEQPMLLNIYDLQGKLHKTIHRKQTKHYDSIYLRSTQRFILV